MKHFLLLFCICLSFLFIHSQSVLVEAEAFDNKGGWKVDQQFMDLMGSPYLLAHGLGKCVDNATTKVSLPKSGIYHVYVRTYNWTSPWHSGKGPGKFNIYVDGKKLPNIVGVEGDKWEWQYAGEANIKKTEAILALRDLSGFDGRCDAVYLTADINDIPPENHEILSQWRMEKHNWSVVAPCSDNFDLIVVGAGIAGMSAAVSAARLGCKVALINDRPLVGGNNSSEIRVHLGGRIEIGKYPELGSLQKEFGPSKGGNAMPASYYEDQKKMDWLNSQEGVTLFLNYRVNRVKMKGQKIESITAQHIESGELIRFESPLFVDCTGDGTVGYLAGADFRMGREGKDEFGESIAPEEADAMTMGSSVQWYSEDTKKRQTFPDFCYGVNFNDLSCEPVDMGEWTWETGMNYNQINDFERVRDYGLLVIYSNWSYIKNHLNDNKQFRNRKLSWVAYIAGKRESRRLLGDYVLHEDDILKRVAHEDASFATSWTIDLHFPDPENSKYFPGNEFKATTNHLKIYAYDVPYRCLYSRNIDNLFMAGRNISATHVALGTTRVMRTAGMMGEVVGMAASICKDKNALPRDVYRYHLDDLKNLMREGVGKKGLVNNQTYNIGAHLKEEPDAK